MHVLDRFGFLRDLRLIWSYGAQWAPLHRHFMTRTCVSIHTIPYGPYLTRMLRHRHCVTNPTAARSGRLWSLHVAAAPSIHNDGISRVFQLLDKAFGLHRRLNEPLGHGVAVAAHNMPHNVARELLRHRLAVNSGQDPLRQASQSFLEDHLPAKCSSRQCGRITYYA